MAIPEDKLTDDLFEDAELDSTPQQKISEYSPNSFLDSWRRLKGNKGSIIGLVLIVLIIALAIFGPIMSSYDFRAQDLSRSNLPPKVPVLENIPFIGFDGIDIKGNDVYEAKNVEENFWFGTDDLGRDVWTRV